METTEPQNFIDDHKLSHFRKLIGIVSSLSIIIGVFVSLVQLSDFVENNRRADMTLRLTTLSQVNAFLAEDEEMRRKAQSFMKNSLPAIMANKGASIRQMGSGEAFYLSPEMAEFTKINYHYQQLGALAKLGYVEFPLIFEVIPFPDTYMNAVEPLNKSLAENWKGPGQELPGLWANIQYLRKCFEISRSNPSKKPACQNE